MTDQLEAPGPAPSEGAPAAPSALSSADRATSAWFVAHYEEAASQVIDFLGGECISMTGTDVADVGCGDGIIDLGVAHKAKPRSLVGFDIEATDVPWLVGRAREEGVGELPDCLEFRTCEARSLPADDSSFDIVFTWSAFEHIENPVAMFREICRVLRPGGVVMLQIWPLYASEHGAHLWQCIPDAFVQFLHSAEEIERQVRTAGSHAREQLDEFLQVYAELNRLTLDDLQRAMLAAALRVAKLEILSEPVHIPAQLARRSLSQLGISGVKLLAVHG